MKILNNGEKIFLEELLKLEEERGKYTPFPDLAVGERNASWRYHRRCSGTTVAPKPNSQPDEPTVFFSRSTTRAAGTTAISWRYNR